MSFEEVRPFISGAIGACIALWFTSRWTKRLPKNYGLKSSEHLVQENRWRIRIAGLILISSLLLGIFAFKIGYYDDNDWRAGGIVMGGAFSLPLVWLIVSCAPFGLQKTRECLLAFSISQKTPVIILYPLMVLGGVIALLSLFWPK